MTHPTDADRIAEFGVSVVEALALATGDAEALRARVDVSVMAG